MNSKMLAAKFIDHGNYENLKVLTVPRPNPKSGELLIKVAAAGLNRADVMQGMGVYPPPAGVTDIPGLEVSGEVVQIGPETQVEHFKVGDSVCALLAGGGYAEYAVAPVGQIMPIPAGVSVTDAAALPEVAATVVSNLSYTVDVKSDDWVLVHGGSGGIGTFALQYLKAIGAKTIATGSTPNKLEWAKKHGADFAINYKLEDFVTRVKEITNGTGVDYILDVVGAKYLSKNVSALADEGRLVVIGLQGGVKAELSIGELLSKRAGVIATALRSRELGDKNRIIAEVKDRVWPLIETDKIKITVDKIFPLEKVAAAHKYFAAKEHKGKILLKV